MGKWNDRWIPNPRSHRHKNRGRFQRELPPPYPAEPNENSVPEWEKKFCYLVGSVPWRKVLNTKTFASCYPDVMHWDDSEAKDTFHSAKRRFWVQTNGLRTDGVPLPDPNAYIDQIDWNTSDDTTDLFRDLDCALSAANADTKEETEVGTAGVVDISALTQNSKWQEWHHGIADDVWDSGGGWDTCNAEGWDNGGWGPVNAMQDKPEVPNDAANPWDCGADKINRPVNNHGWGHCNDKSRGWEQPEQYYSTMNPHNVENSNNANFQGHGATKDNGWAASGSNSWGRNHHQNNFKKTKGWVDGSVQHKGASAAREWRTHGDNSQFRNSWNNSQQKKTDSYYKSGENQDWGNRGDRKRESPNTCSPRSKSPRLQRTNNQSHDQQSWRNRQSMQRAGSSVRPS